MRIAEHMRRVETERFTVRLWLDGTLPPGVADLMAVQVLGFARTAFLACNAQELAREVEERHWPSLNAVEVLNKDGNGFLVYPEWP